MEEAKQVKQRWVYGIRVGEYVKIGCSTNPEARMSALRSGCTKEPADLERTAEWLPLFKTRGDFDTERLLHAILAPGCAAGEWFHWAYVRPWLATQSQSAELALSFGHPKEFRLHDGTYHTTRCDIPDCDCLCF